MPSKVPTSQYDLTQVSMSIILKARVISFMDSGPLAFLEKALLTVITAGQPRLPVNHKHPVHTVACVCLCCLQANSLVELLHFGPLCVCK